MTSTPVFAGASISVKKDLRVTAQITRLSRADYFTECVAKKSFKYGPLSLSPFNCVFCVQKASL